MASSSDPPEDRELTSMIGRRTIRGMYGDPPSDSSQISTHNNFHHHADDDSSYNGYAQERDMASMSTVAVENPSPHHNNKTYHGGSGGVVLPGPSVLRNGNNYNNMHHPRGNINMSSGSVSSYDQQRELRSKRITSTRRISSHVDNYNEYDDDNHSGHSSYADRRYGSSASSSSNSKKRGSLFAKTVAVLVGTVAILGLTFHQEMKDSMMMSSSYGGSTQSRVLKNTPQVVNHHPPGMNLIGEAVSTKVGRSEGQEEETESERTLKSSSEAATNDASKVSQFVPTGDAPATTLTQGHHSLESTDYMHTSTHDFLDDFDQRRRRAADLPDGTIFTEPAFTRMCRTIVDRLDAYDAGVTTFEQVVFTESEYVCRDPDSPYTSVLSMFAAQLLDSANNYLGLNVDYTHRCAKWERYCTGNMTTIQFHLPDPLLIAAYDFQPSCVDGPMLRTICTDALAAEDSTDPHLILFPNGYLDESGTSPTCALGCYFSQVLPWIRNNLRAVATSWLNTVETRALTFWLRNAQEFSHREKDDMEVSVVSLSCANDGCDMSQQTCDCQFDPLPNWVYAMHIPRSSTNVAIVVSPTCAKFGEGCTLHAQELYHFLGQLYPRADITYNVITSTSSWYMRMITADHLVCPPGVGCLLPAIARDAYTYVYETTSPTVGTWLTCTPQDYLNRLTIPSFPPNFVQGDCRHLRARIGAWEPDLALAPEMQYNQPVDGYLGCADANYSPTAEEPYRAPTTYRWDESVWATCPIEVMKRVSTSYMCLVFVSCLFQRCHCTNSFISCHSSPLPFSRLTYVPKWTV